MTGRELPLGMAVLDTLTATYREYARCLGFRPDEPGEVAQTAAAFQDGRAPYWAEARTTARSGPCGIRPADAAPPGLYEPTIPSCRPRRGNCPTWLHEGIAQWLEGGDPAREDAALTVAVREGRLIPLLSLEGPFQNLSEADASQAYAESLSAVAHVLRKRGEAGVVRLLSALGDRLPSEAACGPRPQLS
jgi:hypothetical protein